MSLPRGYHHSEETKRKIGTANSVALKGKRHSLAARRRMSLVARKKGFGKWMEGRTNHHSQKAKVYFSRRWQTNRNPRWVPIGSTHLTGDGEYVLEKVAEHKWRKQHRVVIERIIGRPLRRSEIVHHINENKHDNRPENLEVLTREEHGIRHQPKGSYFGAQRNYQPLAA